MLARKLKQIVDKADPQNLTKELLRKSSNNPKNDLELEQYTDPNEPHTITIHKVIRDEHGDVDGSELVTSATAETEEKADQKALELMRKYNKGV